MRYKFKEEYINKILTHSNDIALLEIEDEIIRCNALIEFYKQQIIETSWIEMSKSHHALIYETIYKKDLELAQTEVLKKIQNLLDYE